MPSDERSPDTLAVPAVPVCFRHPARETYLRCARCERSICTDCMATAPVGFHCPECVREGGRTVREQRTIVGGRSHTRHGVMTGLLIAVCVIVYGLQQAVGPAFTDRLDLLSMTNSISTLPGSSRIGVAYGDWYRLVTSMFVHLDTTHILFNMLSLWFVGVPVETRLGRTRFLLTYFTCGIAGAAVAYAGMGMYGATLGASGAIFGLMGVLAVLAIRERFDVGTLVAVIGLNLVLSFTLPGISWQSHVGGLAAGLIIGVASAYAPRPGPGARWYRNPQVLVPSAAGIGVLAISVVVVLVHTSHLREGALALPGAVLVGLAH